MIIIIFFTFAMEISWTFTMAMSSFVDMYHGKTMVCHHDDIHHGSSNSNSNAFSKHLLYYGTIVFTMTMVMLHIFG